MIKSKKNRKIEKKTERKKFTLLRNFPNSKAKVKGIKNENREKIINQKIQKDWLMTEDNLNISTEADKPTLTTSFKSYKSVMWKRDLRPMLITDTLVLHLICCAAFAFPCIHTYITSSDHFFKQTIAASNRFIQHRH